MTNRTEFLDGKVTLYHGDARDVLRTLPPDHFHACVTDPPYSLVSIAKRFGNTSLDDDTQTSERARRGADSMARFSRGFMGLAWDNGEVAHDVDFWRAVWRVLRPGAHLCAFGGTRTYHRLACAIEDAGFEIRDCIQWLYGSGFPKSHDVGKAIDRLAGAGREVIGVDGDKAKRQTPKRETASYGDYPGNPGLVTTPATDAAREWAGFGTSLKPCCEMVVLCRKPLSEGSVAENVLKWGCGALNIDACRVGGEPSPSVARRTGKPAGRPGEYGDGHSLVNRITPERYAERRSGEDLGRWPPNVAHDGSPEVLSLFPDTHGGAYVGHNQDGKAESGSYRDGYRKDTCDVDYGDSGSASRFFKEVKTDRGRGEGVTNFQMLQGVQHEPVAAARYFYCAKADADSRIGSRHPTVKPVDLMQWLCRLVCVRGGCVIDPLSGTGSTGEAAWREGMQVVLIEREEAYCADIARRMALAVAGPMERSTTIAKEKTKSGDVDLGPLFGGRLDEDK